MGTKKISGNNTEKRYKALIENAHDAIVLYNVRGVVVYASPSVKKVIGYTPVEILGKKGTDPIHPDDVEHNRNVFYEVIAKPGKSLRVFQRIRHKKGHYMWCESVLTNLLHVPEVQGVVSNFRDITEKRIAEDRAHTTQQILETISRNISEGIYMGELGGDFVYVNDAYLKLFGYKSMDELKASVNPRQTFAYPEEAHKVSEILRRDKGIINYECELKKKSGDRFTGIITIRLLKPQNGSTRYVGTLRDITKEKKVQQQLTAVIESTKDSIFALDRKLNYLVYNEHHAKVTKILYGVDLQPGMNYLEIVKKGKDHDWLKRDLQRALRGHEFSVVRSISYKGYTGDSIEIRYNPIQDHQRKVNGVAVFVRDITEQKKYEQRLNTLNEELTHQNWQLAQREGDLKAALEELSERNFELDQFVYKTSHDLRSPLSSILGLVNLARLDKDKVTVEDYLVRIEGRIKKLDEFIRSMLDYARVNRAESLRTEINLEQLAASCVADLQYLDNFNKVKTTIKADARARKFPGDPLRLRIILSNIISNSYKYYNPDARSYVKITFRTSESAATITFKDNGIGIRKEHLGRIFDMFYRATEKSQGSGLGMYIVKQAVDRMGGKISIKSEYGKGTLIKITLPKQ
jgi:PAS domain S-box-containing protein